MLGNYNAIGLVDAADYVVWRKTSINGQQAYNNWRSHFGKPAGNGSGASLNVEVPEPSTLVVLVLVAGVCSCRHSAA